MKKKSIEKRKLIRFGCRAKAAARSASVMAVITGRTTGKSWFCTVGSVCYGVSLWAKKHGSFFTKPNFASVCLDAGTDESGVYVGSKFFAT